MSRKSWGKCRTRTMAALAAAFVGFLGFMSASALPAAAQIPVTTYHYDNNRTGWNQTETALTPANVGSATFGLLQKITLDDQVDAQPLVVPGVLITAGKNQGVHDVVYVATENNSVYAIDVHSGTVLLNPNFGTPVSYPLGCNNNGPNVGITATPVIDSSSNTLYVMIYTQDSSGPAYRLHALDLGSLADKVTPQLVTASHTLTNGTTFNFNATYQRQRSGLLLANGSVYAGFASFCDSGANLSRGWLLGWTAGTLAPFPSNRLNDQQASSPNTFFLSSIWMSGYAPAIDDEGNVLFVTGNSDPSGTTYDGVTNIQESVVKVSPTLTTMVDLFTPQDWADLDEADNDFGAGGVLVLPDQPGATPHLAVAAGKDGNMYLMNEDHLGGYSPTTNNVLGTYSIGGCWCGPSYFVDPSDGAGRVVSSGGGSLEIWKVQTSPSVSLTNVGNVSGLGTSAQDGGFFTSISSNGTANPIIWAISRPLSANNGSPISLYAFNAESGGGTPTKLFQATAGSWPNMTGNANLIPVVANGLVFVASNQQVQIFGLLGGTATTTALTSSLNPSVSGKPVLFTATVSSQSGGGVPMGKVQFMSGTAVLATATLSSGTARYTDSKLQTGNNNITAVYEGSSTYSGSTSSPVDQFVLIATTTTLTSSPSSSSYGQVVNFTAAVTSGSGTPPNGETVTFRQGTTMLGTGTLSGGSATFSTAALGVGTRAVTAVYGGDTTFAASTSKLVNQTIVKSTTSAALTSSQSPSVFAQSVSFTATVTPQFGSPPTGTVTFRNGTATLGTAPLTDGVASFTTTRLPVGSASITASYNGSPDFTPSTSTALSQIVNQASTTTALTSQLNPSTYRQAVTFTATLTAPYGGTITGTVTFMDGSTTLKTLVVGGGEAKYTTSMLATGVHNITAIYSGSSNFIGSSNSISQTVN